MSYIKFVKSILECIKFYKIYIKLRNNILKINFSNLIMNLYIFKNIIYFNLFLLI